LKFSKDKKTIWDGVRNYGARNNLRDMKKSDLALFYHSNEGLEIVGIAKVSKESFQDPTTDDKNWVAVEFSPFKKLKNPVSLALIKQEPSLEKMELVRLMRLSVSKVTAFEFDKIMLMANTTL
jgi:predicted RNA-binding protein with PUA-like domain